MWIPRIKVDTGMAGELDVVNLERGGALEPWGDA
jgi:hypothetical protein